MGLRHESFGERHHFCNVGKKHRIPVSLLLMVKIEGFREVFQPHKLTGQKDTRWVIEDIPSALKQGVSSYRRRDQDARIDERANQCASSLPHLRRCWAISLSMSSQSSKGRPLARIFWR